MKKNKNDDNNNTGILFRCIRVYEFSQFEKQTV